jgi:ABC-2 type transport system permease protein
MFLAQLKNELRKLFGKKRTYIGFGAFVLAQTLMLLMFKYTRWQSQFERLLAGNGYLASEYISALTVALVMLVPQILLLLPLYVTLIGGDLVAKEAEDGTLRMILSRPVSRVRLLCLKWLAGFVFSIVLVLALAAGGMFFCGLFFPVGGGLFAQVPEQDLGVFNFTGGVGHFLLAHLFLVAKACAIMSLAFMFSCFNMKPAAAAILALSLILIDRILMEIPYFHDLRNCFFGYHLNVWQLFLQSRIPWWQVGESVGILFGASLTFLIVGISVFQVRDIKS